MGRVNLKGRERGGIRRERRWRGKNISDSLKGREGLKRGEGRGEMGRERLQWNGKGRD